LAIGAIPASTEVEDENDDEDDGTTTIQEVPIPR